MTHWVLPNSYKTSFTWYTKIIDPHLFHSIHHQIIMIFKIAAAGLALVKII